jgi:hypothetical protein
MTQDEEKQLLKLLELYDPLLKIVEADRWSTRFWLKFGVWAKTLATVAAGAAGVKYLGGYLGDLLRGTLK